MNLDLHTNIAKCFLEEFGLQVDVLEERANKKTADFIVSHGGSCALVEAKHREEEAEERKNRETILESGGVYYSPKETSKGG